MKRFAALLLLLCSCAAWADEASHRRVAEELMGLTQTEATVRNWRKRFEAQAQEMVEEAVQGRRPEQLSDAQRQSVRRFSEHGAEALDAGLNWNKLKDPLAKLYMDTFTESETRELVVFYKTALGQKMLRGLPALSEGIAKIVRAQVDVMRPQLQGISQDFQAEFARAASAAPSGAKPADKVFDKPAEKSSGKVPVAGACRNAKTGQACA